jgi:hypothetical protein
MAPPERPVPAPRAVIGTPWRLAIEPRGYLRGAAGQDDGFRQPTFNRGIVLVYEEVFGGVEHPAAADGCLQIADERAGCGHDSLV